MVHIKRAMYTVGGWFTADPWRIQIAIVLAFLAVAAVAAFAAVASVSPDPVLVAPGSGGGTSGTG